MKIPERTGDRATPLRDASVQDIQFELLRRGKINDIRGEKLIELLLSHRNLWEGIICDQLGFWDEHFSRRLPAMSLIKLRDIRKNQWNVDTPYIFAKSEKTRIGEGHTSHWCIAVMRARSGI